MINIIKPYSSGRFFEKNKTTKVVTHSGLFHADEVFSVTLLNLYYRDITVLRTRDQQILEKAKADPSIFVLDVGMELNPEKLNFDHHHPSAPDDLSTVALLFEHLFPYYRDDRNLNELYNRLIKGISDWDTGNTPALRSLNKFPLYLPQLISAFNRQDDQQQDRQFINAVNFAHTVLANEMNTAKEIAQAKEIWERKKVINENTVLLEDYCTFWRTIQDKPQFKYIVQPDSGNWSVVSVNSNKYPLPVIKNENPSKVVFQHKARFITVFKHLKDALTFAGGIENN
jgi:uncharacterized UPF0160 family protein